MDNKSKLSSIKDKMKGSLETVKTTAKSVKKPELKLPELKKPEEIISQVKDKLKKKESEDQTPVEKVQDLTVISTKAAIKIFYYLIAVDGQFLPDEKEKFELIGREMNPNYDEIRKQIIGECRTQLGKVIDPEDRYEAIREGVEDALNASVKTEDTFITPKLLVWDMLTIAYSDGDYDEAERKLIKFIVRKLNIDKAVFLEMESSILTLIDLEKELQWIKTTDRPYLQIESMVNEIEDRKQVIFSGVKDLIAL